MDLAATSEGRYRWERPLGTGDKIVVTAMDVRQERTGLHAHIGIGFSGSIAAHDVFNVGRNEERQRLSKSASSQIRKRSNLAHDEYDELTLKADLDEFCLELDRVFNERFIADVMLPKRRDGTPYALRPFIVKGGGTVFFGAPGAGKSNLSLIMCQCLTHGLQNFWPCVATKVCYVNLERSADSMRHRLSMINSILGLGEKGMIMVNARGESLDRVSRSVKATVSRHKAEIVWIDSISRAGVGSLVHDDSANKLIDVASSLSQTWAAIGHTPRDDSSHSYGSVMFEAGEDVGVQVSSERRGNTLGIMLQMRKANDIPIAKTVYYALEFEESADGQDSWLSGFRPALEKEFPGFIEHKAMTRVDQITLAITQAGGRASPTQIAKSTGIAQPHVSKILSGPLFQRITRDGSTVFYGLATNDA